MSATAYFIVGSNMPGYLPEAEEPRVFHAIADAREALAEIMREDAGRCFEQMTDDPGDRAALESIAASLEGSAGILTGAAHELDPSGAFCDVTRDSTGNDRAYWIEPRTMAQLLKDGTASPEGAAELAYGALSEADEEVAALIDPDCADHVALSRLIADLTDLRDAIAAQYAAQEA